MKSIHDILAGLPLSGVSRNTQLIALLPILEHPYVVVVIDELQQHGIDTSLLVQFAIKDGSDYWRGRAIQWLIDGHPINLETSAILECFGHGHVGKQKDRHRTLRLAKHQIITEAEQ